MSSVPVICPQCYKSLPGAAAGADGLVRCNACGHGFPPSGGASSSYAPPSFTSSGSKSPVYQLSPLKAETAYGNSSSGNFGPLYSSNMSVGGKFAPIYPPASGPQNPGSPGMIACGVITGFELLGLLCCGGAGAALYFAADEQLAQNPGPMPFNQSNNFPPPIIIPPPNIPQPVFPDLPHRDPFEGILPGIEPALPAPAFDVPPPGFIPGVPNPPVITERTLDAVLQELATADVNAPHARELMGSLSMLPVDEARRGEVVDAMLNLFSRAGRRGTAIVLGRGSVALEKWASKAESTKLALFAAACDNHSAQRAVLNVLARNGGDEETAKALLPLFNEIVLGRSLTNVYEKIGGEAEEPLLAGLDSIDSRSRRIAYEVLGRVGGEKSKARLQEMTASENGSDAVHCREAIAKIESRLATEVSSDSR